MTKEERARKETALHDGESRAFTWGCFWLVGFPFFTFTLVGEVDDAWSALNLSGWHYIGLFCLIWIIQVTVYLTGLKQDAALCNLRRELGLTGERNNSPEGSAQP